MVFLLRVLCCAAGGTGCGFASLGWVRHLQQQRSLNHHLTKNDTRLLILTLTLLGGVIGGFSTGWVFPLFALVLLGIAATVFVMDWFFRIIPNQTVLAVLLMKLLLLVPALLKVPGCPDFSLWQSIIGLVACFIVFSLPGALGKAVGAGDIKFAAATGFLLGINYALLAIGLMGLLMLGYLAAQRKAPILAFLKTSIPMGPFIAVGMFAAFVWSAFPM